MALMSSIVSWLTLKRISQIDLFMHHPIEIQNEELFKLLEKAKNTEWGLRYDYKSIDTIAQFKDRFPVQDYETLKGHILRMKHGEQNLLWPSEIKWFAKSSGTTCDKSKFIPVSKEALEDCHFRGGKDIIAIYNSLFPNTTIYKGKCLSLGGSCKVNSFSSDSYYGDLSAVLLQNLPLWAEIRRIPNLEIAMMEEWDTKIEKMAETALKDNVAYMAGVPSWILVLLKRVLELSGKDSLNEVWPNLELFAHGGVSFLPYREQYDKIMAGAQINYMETYNASEGFFGIQTDLERDDMMLMLDYGIYYEFIPIEHANDEFPVTYSLDEIELNKNYAMVISTNGGLWRYKIGDTVSFTTKYPFRFKITGRVKHFINAFGEELIVDNADKGLHIACEKTGAIINEYTAGPIYMSDEGQGGHEWIIEFEKAPERLDYFTELLDTALKNLNSDYEAKRFKNMALRPPKITIAPKGTFLEWMRSRGKVGGQNKVPRLSNNRKYLDDLIKLC